MKLYISTLCFISLVIFGSETIVAQQQRQNRNIDPDIVYKKLDADKDGKISKEEVDKADRPRLKENFSKIDADNDGFISKEEFVTILEKRKRDLKK